MKPGSSRRPFAHDPALELRRGTLRDRVGALRNLEQLLRSVRAGPRALASLLPEAAEGAREAGAQLEALEAALVGALPRLAPAHGPSAAASEPGARGITPRAVAGAARLAEALAGAAGQDLSAARRLGLERTLTEVLAVIDGARLLLDVLEQMAFDEPVTVDAGTALRDALTDLDPPRPDAPFPVLVLSFVPDAGAVTRRISPPTLYWLVALAGATIADEGQAVEVRVTPEGLRLSPTPRVEGARVVMPRGPEAELALAAITATLGVERRSQGSGMVLEWPR